MKKLNQSGLIPLIIAVLGLVILAIVLVFMRVNQAQQ
jgi:hypothetical protein